jgi:hypothetical protein
VTAVHATVGMAVLVTSLGAGLWGAWAWWRGHVSRGFWTLLRVSQAVLFLEVLIGASLLVIGREPARLHLLYGLLPLGVSFIAEQLRLVSADQVLQRRGMDEAREMEALPAAEQQAIVAEIVTRETGVMAASALVVFVLALRASGVAGFLG